MKAKLTLLLLTLIAFALRVYGLSFQPLWGDEGWSFYFANKPFPEMLALTAVNIHPPLYYALLQVWFSVTASGPELARFMSLLFGVLTIPTIYALGTELLAGKPGTALGMVSAGLVTFAPLALYYSQEVRMYSLVTWLGLVSVLFFVKKVKGQSGTFWPYIITTTLALYSNYFAVFIIIFQGLYLLIQYRLRHQLTKALLWIGLLYLPWVIFAANGLAAYVSNKVSVERYIPLGPVQYFGSYLRAFSLGHLSEAWQPYSLIALAFVAAAILGAWNFRQSDRQNRAQSNLSALLLLGLYLLVPLSLGWLVNLRNPFTPLYFERTLLFAAPAWWILISAGLLWLWQKHRVFTAATGALLLTINLVGIFDFYVTPRYSEQDYRPLLAEIAARAAPDDTLLASYQWQLGLYQAYLPNAGPQFYEVPNWGKVWGTDSEKMTRDLSSLLEHGMVWFPAYQAEGHIWEDQAETIMAQRGYPAVLEWYNPETKLSLVGGQVETQPGPSLNFANILQADVNVPLATEFESGRGIIPVEITWAALTNINEDLLITLKLVDERGNVWAKRDTFPQANQASFSDMIQGEILLDRHGLLVSAGTPPGAYSLRLALADSAAGEALDILDGAGQPQGIEAQLADISIYPPRYLVGANALPVQTRLDVPFGDALNLVGYSANNEPVTAGETLPVNLFWQSLDENLPNLTTFVQLQDEQSQAVALTERPPVYPATQWERGTLLRDLHQLRIPSSLSAGSYTLAAGVLLPDKTRLQTVAGDQVVLGAVTVETRPHNFNPPRPSRPVEANFGGGASLIGYDLSPRKPGRGDDLALTMYWRGEAGFDRNWAVFAHLVDVDGNIAAQQDHFPGDGELPTTGWISGEYIADKLAIPTPVNIAAGEYALQVGLYDPNNFERVPIVGAGDSITLQKITFSGEE